MEEYAQTFDIDTSKPDALETAWRGFSERVQKTINKNVPSKTTQGRYSYPWIDTSLRRAIRRKQRAHTKARKTGKKRDQDRYKRLQQEVKDNIKKASHHYLDTVVTDDFKTNSKKLWAYVKSKGQESQGVSLLKNTEGYLKSDNCSKAEILNNQFKSVFTEEDLSHMPDKGDSPYQAMDDITVTEKGVQTLLRNLQPNKATGPDSIPAFILKSAADEITPILTKMFQHSLDVGQVPTDWREAWVVPIFKKGDRHLPANYRPVSLTSIVCKVLEHIVHSSIMTHYDQHGILTDCQHGFRKKRSCETQLLATIHDITKSMAKGLQVCVDHKVLSVVYNCLNDAAPTYLQELITHHQPERCLRSTSQYRLRLPSVRTGNTNKKKMGFRAFASSAPTLWNSLLLSVKESFSIASFKRGLKTHLFKQTQ
ncbi:hypothetical protein ACOMHN_014196 [Nucella lapillus]